MSSESPFEIPETLYHELEQFVLKGIRQNVEIDKDIIPVISGKTNWDWDECRKFVNHIKDVHKKEIALFSRSIFLLIISVGILVFITMIAVFVIFIGYEELFSCKYIEFTKMWRILLGYPGVKLCLYLNAEYLGRFTLFITISLLIMITTILGLFFTVQYLRRREIKT